MPSSKNNQPVAEGDEVVILCKVLSVANANGEITVELKEPDLDAKGKPTGNRNLLIHASQVLKEPNEQDLDEVPPSPSEPAPAPEKDVATGEHVPVPAPK